MTPDTPSRLPDPQGPLTAARPAADGVTLCQGDRTCVRVGDRDGVTAIRTDAGVLVQALTTDFGPCGNVLATPGRVRRELLSAEGSVWEDVFALPRLPGVRVQWSSPADRDFTARLRWRVRARGTPENAGARLRWTPEEGDGMPADPHLLFRLHPPPDDWSWEPLDEGWTVQATVRIPAGSWLDWAVGIADRLPVARAAVDAMDRFDSQEVMQDGWLRELASRYLRTRTGVPDVDDALEWAKARASGLDLAGPDRIRAQLGAGLFREAEATVKALAADGGDAFGEALGAYLMWTGEYDAPAVFRDALAAWLDARTRDGRGRSTSHDDLIQGLDGLGYGEEADGIRALPLRPTANRGGAVGGGRLVLPVAGQAPVPHTSGPEAAWRRFRRGCDVCVEGARRPDVPGGGAYDLLRTLVERILGVRAEAALGRLEMRPAFPAHVTSFQVERIRVGKGAIDFRFDREGGRHRYLFQPSEGAMPVNVVFRPSVVGTGIAAASVDGQLAELDWEAANGRAKPRLQLPVDRERTVEFEVEEGDRTQPSDSM